MGTGSCSKSEKPTASWTLRVQSNGRRRDIGLGSASLVSLAEAREEAGRIRKAIHAGQDPIAERRNVRHEVPTFRNAALKVHEERKLSWKNGKHQDQWLTTLQTYAFPWLGERLVSDIEGPAIRNVLAAIWLSKPETARRVRQRIGVVLDWSYSQGFRSSEAPMRSISRGLPRQPKTGRHFEALPFEDMPAFVERLRHRPSVGRLALEFLILTAVRSGEVRGACWAEIDLKKNSWTIPAERMKAGKPHVVPLDKAALNVLQRVKDFAVPATVRYLVVGRVYDMETRADLTAARLLELNPDLLAAGGLKPEATSAERAQPEAPAKSATLRVAGVGLPGDGAISWGPVDGPKVIVLSDFQCGYCRRLSEELVKLGARVEERPISIFGAPSRALSERVICAPDPVAALHAAYAGRTIPKGKACPTKGLDANEAFAKAHKFGGTPILIRPTDGAVLEGYRDAATIGAWLAKKDAR